MMRKQLKVLLFLIQSALTTPQENRRSVVVAWTYHLMSDQLSIIEEPRMCVFVLLYCELQWLLLGLRGRRQLLGQLLLFHL